MKNHILVILIWTFFSAALFSHPASGNKTTAHHLIETSDIDGGLVVLVGLDDPDQLAGMQLGDSYIIHGLDTDPAKVAVARKKIAAAGQYGRISVTQFDGNILPYVNNLVNLIIIGQADSNLQEEIHRVLAPRGISVVNGVKQIKPVPVDIDEWTHYEQCETFKAYISA